MLKRIAAILLLIMLFFNWYGYRIITGMLASGADQRLESRLDNNDYDESQLIELKVPLNMPYQTSQSEFERHYGEIKIEGRYYTYVKRKIDNGFLVLKCIPNESKQKIRDAGDEFFKKANGLDGPADKNQRGSYAKSFWSEYDDQLNRFDLAAIKGQLNSDFTTQQIALPVTEPAKPWHPPA